MKIISNLMFTGARAGSVTMSRDQVPGSGSEELITLLHWSPGTLGPDQYNIGLAEHHPVPGHSGQCQLWCLTVSHTKHNNSWGQAQDRRVVVVSTEASVRAGCQETSEL